MDTYKFYYDESEHSRKINYNTVTAPNYYDNFVTVVAVSYTHLDVYKRQVSIRGIRTNPMELKTLNILSSVEFRN